MLNFTMTKILGSVEKSITPKEPSFNVTFFQAKLNEKLQIIEPKPHFELFLLETGQTRNVLKNVAPPVFSINTNHLPKMRKN